LSVCASRLCLSLCLLAACGGGEGGGGGGPVDDPCAAPVSGTPALGVQEIARGLSAPIALAIAPGDGRLFVAEKGGRVRIVVGGQPSGGIFLDLRGSFST
jgi:hypothetical protein